MGEYIDQSRADNIKLAQLYSLIADNSHALTFQTFGQYRNALLEAARRLMREPLQVPKIDVLAWAGPEYAQNVLFIGGPADGRRMRVDAVQRDLMVPGRIYRGLGGDEARLNVRYLAVELRSGPALSCWAYVADSVRSPMEALAEGNSLYSLVNGYRGESS